MVTGRRLYVCAVAALVVSAVVVGLAAAGSGAGTDAGKGAGTGHWPASAMRDLTHLSGLPGARAPALRLTDQRGHRVSLTSLRGRVVVLEPMDPECTAVCPLISQEFIYAARSLGARNSQVTFVGINVNQFHELPSQVLAFSHQHHLDRLANWEFLTGSTAQLRRAWRQYAIAVQPSRTGDVTHSELMYFIDAQGYERWLAFPSANPAAVPQWGQAIAAVAEHLLS